ncbi:MAG TPA: imelysin family protein [Bdellovibrionales bacterium]|nr:imelysin family protein [Bdellovibrionales bacterium]
MFTRLFAWTLLFGSLNAFASPVVDTYVANAHARYALALNGAVEIQKAVDAFLSDPTDETLHAARIAWTEARKPYTETEIYRFYGSPIDNESEGPEGLINAWPLDESYIDYVEGVPTSGFIQNPAGFPALTAEVLRDLNEKDGEDNISTGYHAIEFMLWGQDLYADSAGRRPVTDFTTAPFADRRRQYLQTLVDMLVGDLAWVTAQWAPNRPGNWADRMRQDPRALTQIFTGLVMLTGSELSGERMYVALESRGQEDEHSCFSDTTHLDILHDFLGIKNALVEDGLLELIRAADAAVAGEIDDALLIAERALRDILAPFDQAIVIDAGRVKVLYAIESLENLAEAIRQGGFTVGAEVH